MQTEEHINTEHCWISKLLIPVKSVGNTNLFTIRNKHRPYTTINVSDTEMSQSQSATTESQNYIYDKFRVNLFREITAIITNSELITIQLV
jgi:hypothetical protein